MTTPTSDGRVYIDRAELVRRVRDHLAREWDAMAVETNLRIDRLINRDVPGVLPRVPDSSDLGVIARLTSQAEVRADQLTQEVLDRVVDGVMQGNGAELAIREYEKSFIRQKLQRDTSFLGQLKY